MDSAVDSDPPRSQSTREGLGLEQPTRLTIVQSALAKYRIAVYRELAKRSNVQLKVVYAQSPGLPNAEPDGFHGEYRSQLNLRLLGQPLYWHGAQLAESRDSDVIFLTWDVHFMSLLPAIARARMRGTKVVLWGQGYGKSETRARRGLRNLLARRADALVVYNHEARRRLLADGFDPDRVYVALNTIESEAAWQAAQAWRADPERLEAFRREKGLTPHTLLHVSRFNSQRRIDMLLEASAKLVEQFPDLRIVLIGQNHDNPQTLAQAEALGLSERLLIPGPMYDEQELAPYFLSSRVFAFPAWIGLSLQHAMVYGLPVITHDDFDGQAPEIEALRDEENGLLYSRGNVAELARQIRRILKDDALHARLSAEAERTMREEFTLSNMVDGFVRATAYCMGS